MVSATVSNPAGDIVETYTYDYLGNRTSKTSNGVTTKFTTDLSSGYAQVLKAEKDSEVTYYTRGFELISKTTNGETVFYLYDGGSSVRALTDESGAVTDTLVFDAFGNETEKTGMTENSYGFQGEEQDATGLYYLRARYLDPATGTFTSMDTYGGSLSDPMSLHKYLFANSNPVKYCDPSGHMSLVDMDAAMAIECILNAGYISGYLYIIDASITDPGLEHHDMFGYLGAIGCGMLFAVANLVLSATVTGLLILAIIDTLLGVAGVAKGIADIKDGHIGYGITEILASIAGTAIGWKNFASARAAARATEIADSTERKTNTRRSENNGGSTGSEGGNYSWKIGATEDAKYLGTGNVGDFSNLEGATVEEVLSRIPSDATRRELIPEVGKVTEGFEYKWVQDGKTYRVRVHGPDASAPSGSNAANGWVVRVQQGKKYMDPISLQYQPPGITNILSPNYSEELANATHIPIVTPK